MGSRQPAIVSPSLRRVLVAWLLSLTTAANRRLASSFLIGPSSRTMCVRQGSRYEAPTIFSTWSSPSSPLRSASVSPPSETAQTKAPKKKKKGKSNNNKKKRRKSTSAAVAAASGVVEGGSGNNTSKKKIRLLPRILTDYDRNRHDEGLNQRRLQRDSIGCEHFATCPGCVLDTKVGAVDTIESSKLFFSSTLVRKGRMGSSDDDDGDDDEYGYDRDDDDFYQVRVPSSVTGWRSQAKLVVTPKSSVWGRDGCYFGLYQRGTHNVVPIPHCQVHHPSINRAIAALQAATAKAGTASYTEDSGGEGLRYVQVQVERTTQRVCLTLVWNAQELKRTQPGLSRLTKELLRSEPNLFHSIWCHCNDSTGNNIFAKNLRRWHHMNGPEFVREPLFDRGWLHFTPHAFRQGNMDGFDILALDVARCVPPRATICELYAGVGVLGLHALVYSHIQSSHDDDDQDHDQSPRAPIKWLRCSDENPANTRCFQRSVNSLSCSITGREKRKPRFHRGEKSEEVTLGDLLKRMERGEFRDDDASDDHYDREDHLHASGDGGGAKGGSEKTSYTVASAADAILEGGGQALGANVLIVDPPRRGLDDAVLDELCKEINFRQPFVENEEDLAFMGWDASDPQTNFVNNVEMLLYVSCGFDSLTRDIERLLTSKGGWKIESATGYVLFPGSDHVETFVVLRRDAGARMR